MNTEERANRIWDKKGKPGPYDVIVIGTGHAGCEAALAAARMGCTTMIITLNTHNIGAMPCNPAIGGPAKGQMVGEIDALGGAMGWVSDQSFLQMKVLNRSRGPAVQCLRAQSDKKQLIGEVLESLMDKTAVIKVERRFPHPMYKKYVTKSKKYYAHDPENKCNTGDIVTILESKPISKLKRRVVLNIKKQAVK